jgi:hypothetical protein
VRKGAGVLKIICGSGIVSSEMERKAQRRTFRDSTLMGEARGATFCRRQVRGPDFSGKAPGRPVMVSLMVEQYIVEAL